MSNEVPQIFEQENREIECSICHVLFEPIDITYTDGKAICVECELDIAVDRVEKEAIEEMGEEKWNELKKQAVEEIEKFQKEWEKLYESDDTSDS